jgi:DNA-3-methyladenine glycosylase
MSGRPGIAYVYRVYGMYDCLNVVTGPEGQAGAVLIRAVDVLEGAATMRAARGNGRQVSRAQSGSGHVPDRLLASGPGLVGACFGVDRSWTGSDLCDPLAPLRLEDSVGAGPPTAEIIAGPRVGIAYAGDEWAGRPWRFRLSGNPAVSAPR